jgi:hypothetical protein
MAYPDRISRMTNLTPVLAALEQERNRLSSELERIGKAIAALRLPGGVRRGQRRKLSPGALARIRAAQKLRWAKWRKAQKKR